MNVIGFDHLDFLIGGAASICPAVIINPFEVLKTRLQLQGELQPKYMFTKVYKRMVQSFNLIVEKEGWRALQKGLLSAVCHQFVLNSFRVGISQGALRKGWLYDDEGHVSLVRGCACGAMGGAIGTFFSSPFSLIRTQMQSYSTSSIAVGHQHHFKSMFEAFHSIYQVSGIRGLWRGCFSSMPRGALGSGSQITVLNKTKKWLHDKEIVVQHTMNTFVASLLAGFVLAAAITPADVIITRLYNQNIDDRGKGTYYRGFGDTISKIIGTEGLSGFYKGYWPNYWRLVPQYVLSTTMLHELMELKLKYK